MLYLFDFKFINLVYLMEVWFVELIRTKYLVANKQCEFPASFDALAIQA